MKKIYSIQIPEPCHEDWSNMSPNEKGRFCDSCAKTVVDFTHQKKEDIEKYLLLNQDQNVCGRVVNSQIDNQKDLDLLKKMRRFAAACFLVFGSSLFSFAISMTVDEVSLTELLKTNSTITNASEKVEIIHGGMLIVPELKKTEEQEQNEVNKIINPPVEFIPFEQGKLVAVPEPPDTLEIEEQIHSKGEIQMLGGMRAVEELIIDEPIIEEPFLMGDTVLATPEQEDYDTSEVLDLNLILPDEIIEQFFEVETIRGEIIIDEVEVEELLISGEMVCIPEEEDSVEVTIGPLVKDKDSAVEEIDPTNDPKPEDIEQPKLVVYPNPAIDIVNVKFTPIETEIVELIVNDISGKIILNKKMYVRKDVEIIDRINVIGWGKGVYVLTVTGGEVLLDSKIILH